MVESRYQAGQFQVGNDADFGKYVYLEGSAAVTVPGQESGRVGAEITGDGRRAAA